MLINEIQKLDTYKSKAIVKVNEASETLELTTALEEYVKALEERDIKIKEWDIKIKELEEAISKLEVEWQSTKKSSK